jgi:hypothetical protein
MNKKPAYVLPGLLDGMPYTKSYDTDIRRTFARVRREIAERKAQGDKVRELIRPAREAK